MEVYNQFIDPSTCLRSVACHFTSKNAQNLAVSKGTVLQIYKLIEIELSEETEESNNLNDMVAGTESFIGDEIISSLNDIHYKLAMITEYHLQGRIFDMSKFRCNENPDVDYLIICTDPCKLSIVKWNNSKNNLETTSLHYYEPAMEALFIEKNSKVEKIHRTDPNGLCTSIFTEDMFIFLPFYRDDIAAEVEDDIEDLDKQTKKESKKLEQPADATSDSKKRKADEIIDEHPDEKKAKKYFDLSFIIAAKKLHSDLKNIIDYTYLYSYRNPTIAILYAPETLSWAGFLPKAKDNMKVIVLSLDLANHKADSIMEIPNLPYDVDSIYALPSPVNGFLLTGSNEILHVNSLGSVRGIYTNNYFPDTSDMKLRDQSSLKLALEWSKVEYIGDDQALLISEQGGLYDLGFDESGGISNLIKISPIDEKLYPNVSVNNVLDIVNFPDINSAFLCCQGSDSILLHWKYNLASKPKLTAISDSKKQDEDSWLYGEEDSKESSHRPLTNCTFTEMDRIINCGPSSDFTIGKINNKKKIFGLPNPNLKEDAIICSSGLGKDTCLSVINPTVIPDIKSTLKFSSASKIWTLANGKGITKYLITTDFKTYKTQIFRVDKNYKDVHTHDFDPKQYSIQFATITRNRESYIVQVTPYKINMYSFKFKLIHSVSYDKEINAATIYGRYVIATMKNGEIDIYECNFEKKQLIKIDLPALLNCMIFTYAWIADSSILSDKNETDSKLNISSGESEKETTFWIVTADNRLLVFKKDHHEKVYEFKDIHKFPEKLTLSNMDPNYEADVDPLIKQVMLTSVGDKYFSKDYLFILTYGGEVLIYETEYDSGAKIHRFVKSNDLFEFPVVGAPENSYASATRIERYLFKFENFNGYQCVLVTGSTPFLILREHNSVPRMLKYGSIPALYFAPFNTGKCKDGLIAIDNQKSCRMCELDTSFNYANRVPIKKVPIGATINKVAFDSTSGTYIVATMTKVPYKAIDEDGEEFSGLKEDKKSADNYKGSVKLVSPVNWSIIDSTDLEDNEVCTALKAIHLMIYETVNETKDFILVGSGKYRVEDLTTKGSWKLYEIIDVVPDPSHPEAKNRLKIVTSGNSKGAVLGACNISERFSVIQAQRMLVRMIKKDGNAVPVAFTDTSLYAKDVKSFEDLLIIGDAYDGVSLYGFDAEPYRMLKLGKQKKNLCITACDFIVYEGNLYIIASDEDSILHLLQYDPYDPDSMRGHRLLNRSLFRFNGYCTAMKLENRRNSVFSMINTLNVPPNIDLGHEIIGCNIDGSFYKVSPVNEYSYRRLYSVQNFISDKCMHCLGLNPKMNAIGDLTDIMASVRRPFIDLELIRRYMNMNDDRKDRFSKRLGKNALVDTYRDLISLQ